MCGRLCGSSRVVWVKNLALAQGVKLRVIGHDVGEGEGFDEAEASEVPLVVVEIEVEMLYIVQIQEVKMRICHLAHMPTLGALG